jgi:hypothetical protein
VPGRARLDSRLLLRAFAPLQASAGGAASRPRNRRLESRGGHGIGEVIADEQAQGYPAHSLDRLVAIAVRIPNREALLLEDQARVRTFGNNNPQSTKRKQVE